MCQGCNINPENNYFSEERQRVARERQEALTAFLEDQKKEQTGQQLNYDEEEENDSYGEGKDPE